MNRTVIFFVIESDQSVFFSQTPEQLMEVDNQVLSTKAVAGTIKRTNDEQEDKQHLDAFYKIRRTYMSITL